MTKLFDILNQAISNDATDIQFLAGSVPIIRVNNKLLALEESTALSIEETDIFLEELLDEIDKSENKLQKKELLLNEFASNKNINFSLYIEGIANLQINAHLQNQTIAIHIKLNKTEPKMFSNLPNILYESAEIIDGLILITGPRKHGKSTTLASLITLINKTQNKSILTIENPIEYLYSNINSYIQQVEIGIDVSSAASAINNSNKQDIDIIVINELKTKESIHAAINASLRGQLVIASIPTKNTVESFDYMLSKFSPEERPIIYRQLSRAVKVIIGQRLLNNLSGEQTLATEIMKNNFAISKLIAEGKIDEINRIIETSENDGMKLLSQDLITMVKSQTISFQTALQHCSDSKYYEKLAYELYNESNI